jgi:hypothetical protein
MLAGSAPEEAIERSFGALRDPDRRVRRTAIAVLLLLLDQPAAHGERLVRELGGEPQAAEFLVHLRGDAHTIGAFGVTHRLLPHLDQIARSGERASDRRRAARYARKLRKQPSNDGEPHAGTRIDRAVASEPTGDFDSGQQFTVQPNPAGYGSVVEDRLSRLVAILPGPRDDEVITRAGRWRIAPERRRHSWAIVARNKSDSDPVAYAYPRWRLGAYKLWVAPDASYQLKRNWLTRSWTLRQMRVLLARFTIQDDLCTGVETLERTAAGEQLPLLIALALETIRYDATIPMVNTPTPGP